MRQKFAPVQGGFAPPHGFDKAVFFLKVTRNNILHSLIEVAALLGRPLGKPCFQVTVEMNFHALKIWENGQGGKEGNLTLRFETREALTLLAFRRVPYPTHSDTRRAM